MRLWQHLRSIPSVLPVYRPGNNGIVQALEIDLCIDTERIVDRYLGSYILWLYKNTPEKITEMNQVILGIAFHNAKLIEHYKPLFTRKAYREDSKGTHTVQRESEDNAEQLAQKVLSTATADLDVPDEVPSTVDFFGDETT
jgi:hypothetical protein